MRRNRLAYVLLLISIIVGVLGFSARGSVIAQETTPTPPDVKPQAQALTQLGAQIIYNAQGLARFVSFPDAGKFVPRAQSVTANAQPEVAARGFLTSYGVLFGIQDQASELKLYSSKAPDKNHTFTRFQQQYQGLPVFGGELIVQSDGSNNIRAAIGEVSPNLSLTITPQITANIAAQNAIALVARDFNVPASSLTTSTPQLWIYDPALVGNDTGPTRLVWRLTVSSTQPAPISILTLIDARNGVLALGFNQIDTEWTAKPAVQGQPAPAQAAPNTSGLPEPVSVLGTPLLSTYSANNGLTLPGTFKCDQSDLSCAAGDSHAKGAHKYAYDTYTFYANNFGRDSINNAGMRIVSTVHYDSGYANAFWDPDFQQMVYGDAYGFPLADDVIGHELTHGVTEYESNLFYYYQSGAINESLSDIFGEFVDQTNGSGTDTAAVKWLMGEDVSGLGAIRSLSSPKDYNQPDKMTSGKYYTGHCDDLSSNCDAGGVHTNSGVGNKAAYLMTDGGTFNGKTVTGLGITKVAHIYYDANANLLTSGADYLDLYDALYQACNNLVGQYGIVAGDCQQVRNATDAVEMSAQPTSGYNTDAPLCPSGQTPVNLFYDGLESGAGNWTVGVGTGVSYWSLDSTAIIGSPYAHTGLHALYSYDQGAVSNTAVAMKTGVLLPANAYLYFYQAYGFDDYNGTYYDGGQLYYTTTGLGGTQVDANNLLDGTANPNNGYDGTLSNLYGNPLGGKQAFAGDSHGFISSRYNLSSLSGKTVQFIWQMGTDSSVSDYGWWIDDIRIYTCTSPTNTPTSTRTLTPTITSTTTRTFTPTGTFTRTSVSTNTFTPTITLTPTVTQTPTPVTPTQTPTPVTPTQTPTSTITLSPTPTITLTPTVTNTLTGSETVTYTPTVTDTATDTPTATDSPTPTVTDTSTDTATPTITSTDTATATITNSPTVTDTPTVTSTATDTATVTNTSTITNTPTVTNTPTTTPTATSTATVTNTRTITNTPTITKTFTNTPTRTPVTPTTTPITPTRTPTPITPTKTPAPATATRTNTPITPSATPTSTPTPTATPTNTHAAGGGGGSVPTHTRTPVKPTATSFTSTPTVTQTLPISVSPTPTKPPQLANTLPLGSAGGTISCAPWAVVVPSQVAPDGSGLKCVLLTLANPSTDHSLVGHIIEISVFDPLGQPLTRFSAPLQVCVTYSDSDLQAVGSDTAKFVLLSQENKDPWAELPTTVDTTAHTVCGTTSHLSRFGLFSTVQPSAAPTFNPLWVVAGCGLALLAGAILVLGIVLWRREANSSPYQ